MKPLFMYQGKEFLWLNHFKSKKDTAEKEGKISKEERIARSTGKMGAGWSSGLSKRPRRRARAS